jgi:hypothetical protein
MKKVTLSVCLVVLSTSVAANAIQATEVYRTIQGQRKGAS